MDRAHRARQSRRRAWGIAGCCKTVVSHTADSQGVVATDAFPVIIEFPGDCVEEEALRERVLIDATKDTPHCRLDQRLPTLLGPPASPFIEELTWTVDRLRYVDVGLHGGGAHVVSSAA